MKQFLLAALLALCLACTPQDRALVGVSCARTRSGSTLLGTTYTNAVRKAGGTALVIPTVTSEEEAVAVMEVLDGIIFSGGEDVNPAWYGEEPWNETVECDFVRDRSDSLLARAALASGKPILAICRGSQLMNVILGGSLWQDIPSQYPHNVGHGGGKMHTVSVCADSFLHNALGADSLRVNSWHHQAVKDEAPGIHVVARSNDGIVEAWEYGQIWAVQFHPEKMLADGDESWLPLFKSFVESL